MFCAIHFKDNCSKNKVTSTGVYEERPYQDTKDKEKILLETVVTSANDNKMLLLKIYE